MPVLVFFTKSYQPEAIYWQVYHFLYVILPRVNTQIDFHWITTTPPLYCYSQQTLMQEWNEKIYLEHEGLSAQDDLIKSTWSRQSVICDVQAAIRPANENSSCSSCTARTLCQFIMGGGNQSQKEPSKIISHQTYIIIIIIMTAWWKRCWWKHNSFPHNCIRMGAAIFVY